MAKVAKGPQTWIAPMPALMVGAMIDGKPNFMTAAWAGVANGEPPIISVAIRPARYTLRGIRANSEFSLNVPSITQMQEVDFCGINSGANVDKVERCGFTVFRGTATSAPLIEECPISLECRVVQIVELESHNLVLGEVLETHVSEECLTADGSIDFVKVNPIVFLDKPTRKYCGVGTIEGEAFGVGLEL